MPCTVLIGSQWGDEGKGKIVDVLTEDIDIVVRYQGGNNAGHTVEIGDQKYVLHLVPSGILHSDVKCVMGNGLVVDPFALLTEIGELAEHGVDVTDRLLISDRAHLVLPYHRALDAASEDTLAAGKKIGTTKRGIGPTYSAKAGRTGLRMGDMLDSGFAALLRERLESNNGILKGMGADPIDVDSAVAECSGAAESLAPFITDTVSFIGKAVADDKAILLEGAQGTMLDIDFGTYPFVTSSNATAGGACTGAGIPPSRISRVVGVVKAYTTRVGEGPFPTELMEEVGATLGKRGNEFGATTGRPRRCGWFDAVVARYAAMVNGIDLWAMTKLDVLDTLETIKVCVAYECDGQRYDSVPANVDILKRCTPVYEEIEGWQTSTETVTKLEDLPEKAKAYVDRLCELTGVSLGILSVGPRRASTLRVAL